MEPFAICDLYISRDVDSLEHVFSFLAADLDDLVEGDIKIDVSPENIPDQEKSEDAVRSRQYTWRTKIIPYEVSKELGKLITSC